MDIHSQYYLYIYWYMFMCIYIPCICIYIGICVFICMYTYNGILVYWLSQLTLCYMWDIWIRLLLYYMYIPKYTKFPFVLYMYMLCVYMYSCIEWYIVIRPCLSLTNVILDISLDILYIHSGRRYVTISMIWVVICMYIPA